MVITKKGKGRVITVTSDKFEMVKSSLVDARAAGRIAKGGQYKAFKEDSIFRDYGDTGTAQKMNSQLALANVMFGWRLWFEGIAEVNDFMNNKAKDNDMIYKAIVPGSNATDEGDRHEEVA